MAYTGDDSAQLPEYEISSEPPYSTAREGPRTRQHEPCIAPSTFAYTESDQPITHPSAFGDGGI